MISILVDFTRCVGCDTCWVACETENNWGRPEREPVLGSDGKQKLGDDGKPKTGKVAGYKRPYRLDRNVLTTLIQWEQDEEGVPGIEGRKIPGGCGDFAIRRFCMHCIDPACVSVCPSRAMRKDSGKGPVHYDAGVCLGCRYCLIACPFGIPKFEYDRFAPRVRKCFMCSQRTLHNKPNTKDVDERYKSWPACAAACVEENGEDDAATCFFSNRRDTLKEARRRIRKEPEKYLDHIYGEKEYGGTGVLMLTSRHEPFDGLPYFIKPLFPDSLEGYNRLEESLPAYTGAIISSLPGITLGAAIILAGFWWFCGRRNTVRSEEAKNINNSKKTGGGESNGT
ncbi:MAG: 4Fe-4S dicluster domain-containing protein [Planctomycetota bacterium]|jgi:Fe-S-cluster-containing dehydrogenase component